MLGNIAGGMVGLAGRCFTENEELDEGSEEEDDRELAK